MRRLGKLKIAALVVIILLSLDFSVYALFYSTPKPVTQTVAAQPKPPTTPELLALINQERQKSGIAPLADNPLLDKSAQMKADEMVKNGYGHVDPATGKHGYEYIMDVGARCTYGSENINAATSSDEAVKKWMASKPHHDAILDANSTETGFGIAKNSYYYYFVEHFCQP